MNLKQKLEKLAEKNGVTVDELPKGELFTSGEKFDSCNKDYLGFVVSSGLGEEFKLVSLVDRDFLPDTESQQTDDDSIRCADFISVGASKGNKLVALAGRAGVTVITEKQLESLEKAIQIAKSYIAE